MTSGQAGLGADKKPIENEDTKRWRHELDNRHSSTVLVIFRGNTLRGSVVLRSEIELNSWVKFIERLNDDIEP